MELIKGTQASTEVLNEAAKAHIASQQNQAEREQAQLHKNAEQESRKRAMASAKVELKKASQRTLLPSGGKNKKDQELICDATMP